MSMTSQLNEILAETAVSNNYSSIKNKAPTY